MRQGECWVRFRWPRCIAVASTCMLAVQFALLVAFFLLPRVKPATSPPPPSDERTHRFHGCHQPEEKKNSLRYVPDHLLHSNKSRDVDPSKVPIFCVFHNSAYRNFKKGFTITANMRRVWIHLRVLLTLFVRASPKQAEFSESIQSGRDMIFFGEAAYRWLTSHKFDRPQPGLAVRLRSHRRRNLDRFQYDFPGHAVAPVFFALKAVAPNAKICISISFEVRAFKLVANRSETNTRMEPADPTGYTGTPGLRAFSEVCRASDVSMDPVKYCALESATRNVKLALETPLSIRQKLNVLSKPCVGLWDMEFDDFEGRCSAASRDPWPLTAAVYNALN
ncbi:hypothetical protein MTO96_007889 [Rhipicephalus appendiculatus]